MNQITTKTVCGFGEVMLRLSPVGQQSFGESNTVQLVAGGSEANVLAKISSFSPQLRGSLITALNDDLSGHAIVADLNKYGIDTSCIRWTTNERNGLYYLEQGMGPIVAHVDYDRKGSAVTQLRPDESLFGPLEDADALFVSGITPALNPNCAKNTEIALAQAKNVGIPVFLDVNYRQKLWTPAEARAQMDYCLSERWITGLLMTETDAKNVFGIDCGVDDDAPIDTLIERGQKLLGELKARYDNKCELYILTIRKRITNETGVWTSAALLPDDSYVVGDIFDYVILDRPGAGDACSAGLIAGYLGLQRDGTLGDMLDLAERVKTGLDLGNRAAIVAQKTVGDMGPAWSATEYFSRVSSNKEISR